MNRIKSWIQKDSITITVISTTIFVTSVVIYGKVIYGSTFFSDFLSNWMATLLGVAIGIPIALILNNSQERKTEKERKEKILLMIREEMKNNSYNTTEWFDSNKSKNEKRTVLLPSQLSFETWKALSDSGELQWIKDPGLLFFISETYYYIRSAIYLAEKHHNLMINSYSSEEISQYTVQAVYKEFLTAVGLMTRCISSLIKQLDKDLESLGWRPGPKEY
jgi:hypothetical protein